MILSARKVFPSLPPFLDFLPSLYHLSHDIAVSVTTFQSNSARQITCIHLMTKALKTFCAITALLEACFFQDAWILLRALLEIYVNMAYISLAEDPEEKARLFQEYYYIAKWRMVQSGLRVYGRENFLQNVSAQQQSELKTNYERVKKNYPRELQWSGCNIARMAEEANLKDLYDTVYRLSSAYTHSTAETENAYLRPDSSNGGLVACLDPQPEEDKICKNIVFLTSNIMISICHVYCDAFNIDMKEKLDRAAEDLEKLGEIS